MHFSVNLLTKSECELIDSSTLYTTWCTTLPVKTYILLYSSYSTHNGYFIISASNHSCSDAIFMSVFHKCVIDQFSPKRSAVFALEVEVINLVEVQLMYHTSTDSRLIINDAESCICELLCLLAEFVYVAEEHSVICQAVVSTAIYACSKWSKWYHCIHC